MKNGAISCIITAFIIVVLVIEFFTPNVNADSIETIIGKEKQPYWYFGEGLNPGDFLEYKICDSLLKIPVSPDHCYTITLEVFALLPSPQGNIWIISAHVDHRIKNVDIILQVSDSSFKITTDGASIPYADSLERTLEWIMKFASRHKPQPLVIGKSWGTVASDIAPETELIVMQVDSVHMGEEIIPTYKIGYSLVRDSFLQIRDGFPVPIKAVIYKPISVFKDVPLAMTFDLLNYSNSAKIASMLLQTNQIITPIMPKNICSAYPIPTLQQTDLITNYTELENITNKNIPITESTLKGNDLLKSDQETHLNNSESYGDYDIETETFDEMDFRDKLKNSTTAQILKDLYGPDYEKIINGFDKFIELLTNTTNAVIKDQINSPS